VDLGWGGVYRVCVDCCEFTYTATKAPTHALQLGLATLSSVLTVYLSSSAYHTTSKNSLLLTPVPSQHDGKTKPSERDRLIQEDGISPHLAERVEQSEPPRKVMYFAAGSGIPEIKTILSGFVIHGVSCLFEARSTSDGSYSTWVDGPCLPRVLDWPCRWLLACLWAKRGLLYILRRVWATSSLEGSLNTKPTKVCQYRFWDADGC
jgi:hypothetical protein